MVINYLEKSGVGEGIIIIIIIIMCPCRVNYFECEWEPKELIQGR